MKSIYEKLMESKFMQSDNFIQWCIKNNIPLDSDNEPILHYMGSGDFGEAYLTDDNRIVKYTNSKSEFEFANERVGQHSKRLVDIYSTLADRGMYFILQEYLRESSFIVNNYYDVTDILESQGLDVSGIGYFDESQYEEENGEINPKIKDLMDQIYRIYQACIELGVQYPDIKDDNLGIDVNKNVKMFDVDSRRR